MTNYERNVIFSDLIIEWCLTLCIEHKKRYTLMNQVDDKFLVIVSEPTLSKAKKKFSKYYKIARERYLARMNWAFFFW